VIVEKEFAMEPSEFCTKTKEATTRIKDYILQTPLELSSSLSQGNNSQVYLKMEHLQTTGSFKIRGAANMLLSLTDAEKNRRIITASSGNHAAAMVHLQQKTGIGVTIFLPENANEAKISDLRDSGVHLRFFGTDVAVAEMFAREAAKKEGKIFIPPYNHPDIIAGQATLGYELHQQLGKIDAVFVPIGGGGLASGVAGYLKSVSDEIKIVGCQPKNSAVMYESVKAGKILKLKSSPTISDGTAGGIEEDSVTFNYCSRFVDEYVLVSENEIKEAIFWMLKNHFSLIEGAAALSIASFMNVRQRYKDKKIVLILTGKRIGLNTLTKLLCQGD
jgi:threonine dehydratase